jgi:hypothetical protein
MAQDNTNIPMDPCKRTNAHTFIISLLMPRVQISQTAHPMSQSQVPRQAMLRHNYIYKMSTQTIGQERQSTSTVAS